MTPPSHRSRIIAGTAVASLLFALIAWLLLGGAEARLFRMGEQRRALVSLRALAEVAQRGGGKGEPARAAVATWAKERPSLSRLRVVNLEDKTLEASTAPEDTGDKAAPRELVQEEKPLFDLANDLASAAEANRQESAAFKAEISIQELPSGGLAVTVPLEDKDKVVVGTVMAETPAPPAARPSPLGALAVALLPVLVVAGASLALGGKRGPLLGVAVVALLAAFVVYGRYSLATLDDARREAEQKTAGEVRRDAELAAATLAALKLPVEPALAPASWDADIYRRPLGFVSGQGELDEGRIQAEISGDAQVVVKSLVAAGLLALALLLVFALGGAAWLGRTVSTHRQAYAYVTPAMLGMLVLVFFPFFYGITLSFTNSTIYNTSKPLTEIWVWFRNYADILGDFQVAKRAEDGSFVFNYYNFYWTLFITIVWTVTNVIIGVTGGLFLALLLNTKGLAMRAGYRVLLILPWAMPNYITALIWKGMFHSQFGVINQVLLVLGLTPQSWFETPFTSFMTALVTNGWLSFPFMMVTSLGALQSIPADLYEAARVDGASRWQQFSAITLPALKPALVPAVILSVVWTFNMFNIIYLVTAGEPAGATEILITQAYKFAFEKYRYGYAAAYSTIIFGILVVYGSIQNRLSKATEAA